MYIFLFVHICNYLYLYAGWTFDRISGLQVVALLLGPELQKAESPGIFIPLLNMWDSGAGA